MKLNNYFITVLAYITDIFNWLNQLNTSLQGKGSFIFVMCDEVECFKKNMCLWKYTLKEGNALMFHSLSEACNRNELSSANTIITDHLTKLHDLGEKNNWIRSRFTVMPEDHFNRLSLKEKSSIYILWFVMDQWNVHYEERELSGLWLYAIQYYQTRLSSYFTMLYNLDM